jgi:disulfide bond formation protein DsbB
MSSFNGLGAAKLLALLVPAALLAGAYGSQYLGGLAPCEMCYWQRYAHWAALVLAIGAIALTGMPDRGRSFVWLALLAILISGGIGAYHAGVEAGIFQGFTQCTATHGGSAQDVLKSVMAASMVRCDEIQFEFLGVSMAGWNAIISVLAALVIGWLSLKRPRTPTLA